MVVFKDKVFSEKIVVTVYNTLYRSFNRQQRSNPFNVLHFDFVARVSSDFLERHGMFLELFFLNAIFRPYFGLISNIIIQFVSRYRLCIVLVQV